MWGIAAILVLGGPVCFWWGYRQAQKVGAADIRSAQAIVSDKTLTSDHRGFRGSVRLGHWLHVKGPIGGTFQVAEADYDRYPEGSEVTVWTQLEGARDRLALEPPSPQRPAYILGACWTFATLLWPLAVWGNNRLNGSKWIFDEQLRIMAIPAFVMFIAYVLWPESKMDVPRPESGWPGPSKVTL